MSEIGDSFDEQTDVYYGDDLYNHPFYRATEYLDIRVVWACAGEDDTDDMDAAVAAIKPMLLKSETQVDESRL
jgi:hypothetical protein